MMLCTGVEQADAQNRWDLRARRTIGEVGGSIEFGTVTAVTLGPRGLYVADGMNARITILDSGLHPLRSLGRKGRGPGEFGGIQELTVRGDTVYAYDVQLRRLTALTDTGEVLWTQKPVRRMSDEAADPHPAHVLADGWLLLRGRASPPSRAHGLHRVDRRTGERVRIAGLDYSDDIPIGRIDLRGTISTIRRPLHSADRWSVAPGGTFVAVLVQTRPEQAGARTALISSLSPSGDTLWRHRFRVPGLRIPSGAAVEGAANDYATRMGRRFGIPRREAMEAYQKALNLPEYQLAFDRIVAGGHGEVLLRRGSFGARNAEWWRVTASGVDAVFRLPADHEVVAASARRIYTRSKGPLDEPILTLWTPDE